MEVPAEEVTRETEALVAKYQKVARLPGFRAGTFPVQHPTTIQRRSKSDMHDCPDKPCQSQVQNTRSDIENPVEDKNRQQGSTESRQWFRMSLPPFLEDDSNPTGWRNIPGCAFLRRILSRYSRWKASCASAEVARKVIGTTVLTVVPCSSEQTYMWPPKSCIRSFIPDSPIAKRFVSTTSVALDRIPQAAKRNWIDLFWRNTDSALIFTPPRSSTS